MNVYFVYKVLTNRIGALIIAAGYIALGRKLRPWGESSGLIRRGISVAVRWHGSPYN